MFYEPGKEDHGLPHDPFKASVVCQPIDSPILTTHPGMCRASPYRLDIDPVTGRESQSRAL